MIAVLLLAIEQLVQPTLWDALVIWAWLVAAVIASLGAIYLAWAGFQDRRLSRRSPSGPRATIREENSGMLMRSGMNRGFQGLAYVFAGAVPVLQGGLESHVSLLTGILAVGLSVFSAYVTLRDIAARLRIGHAMSEL